MAFATGTIKKILVDGKVLLEDEFDDAVARAARTQIPVIRLLIAEGRVSQARFLELVSNYLGIPIFKPTTQPLKLDIIGVIPEVVARDKQVLVFGKNTSNNTYQVAMVDPTDIENINFIKEYLKAEIEPYLAAPESLKFGYQLYKRRSSENFEAMIAEKIDAVRSSLKGVDENILENIPLVELLDTIIGYAATIEASDVYFQPQEDSLKIRFRIDGLLKDIISVDRLINEGVVARIKTLSGLRIDEHFRPQDGRFRFRSSDIDLDIRVAVMPTIFGEKTTLRLLSGAYSFLTFEELGMNEATVSKIQKVIKRPHGMILSTGPTGSGKTTTIYAMLYLLNKPDVHIVTIEDPIEYIVPNINQTQVNTVAGITFASGLRSMLRHSPDIIVVGEIRDSETVDISINAALTGHLLISTLHTNDATSAIVRLIDLGIKPFLIGATLNAVLAQRLVRKICPSCREQYTPSSDIITKMEDDLRAASARKLKVPTTLYRGTGCALCHNSGYQGRVGLFELFMIDETVKELIATKKLTTTDLQRAADTQGMVSIFEDGLEKVRSGITSMDELIRITNE